MFGKTSGFFPGRIEESLEKNHTFADDINTQGSHIR